MQSAKLLTRRGSVSEAQHSEGTEPREPICCLLHTVPHCHVGDVAPKVSSLHINRVVLTLLSLGVLFTLVARLYSSSHLLLTSIPTSLQPQSQESSEDTTKLVFEKIAQACQPCLRRTGSTNWSGKMSDR